MKTIAILMSALVLAACGGGGGESGASAPITASQPSAQKSLGPQLRPCEAVPGPGCTTN